MTFLRHSLCLAMAMASLQPLAAQTAADYTKKADPAIRALLSRLDMQQDPAFSASLMQRVLPTDSTKLIVRVTDAESVVQTIENLGGRACRIHDALVTTTLPTTALPALAAMPEVTYIRQSEQAKALTDFSREMTGVDNVHNGTGLETPFTGKGVIVTIVDHGFQFNHRAFLKDATTSRALYTWNHNKYTTPPKKGATLLRGSDGAVESGGHATHVAGIAAGSKVDGVPYYGMAPEADLILLSTTMTYSDVLEELAWAKSIAQDEGKPMVINMSFGSQFAPHDGYGVEKEMSDMVDKGFILVAAAGNENGDKIHVGCTLQNKGDSAIVVMDNKESACQALFVGQPTDSLNHIEFTPCLYNKKTKTFTYLPEQTWNAVGYCGGEINDLNGRQIYGMSVLLSSIYSKANITDKTNTYVAIIAKALTDNVQMHGWEFNSNDFIKLSSTVGVAPDDKYVIADLASGEKIVGVGSFNGRHDWKEYSTGYTTRSTDSETGQLSQFSVLGPTIDEGERPLVAAPGGQIISALNSFIDIETSSSLDLTSWLVTAGIDSNGQAVPYDQSNRLKHFFYGMMSGTSMAAPTATGIIALWLQANPELDYDQIERIIKATSTRDSFTHGTAGTWSKGWGYGKINAYDGLKMALELAEADGITPMIGADQPVTFDRQNDAWRILFHTPCHQAIVSVHALSGTAVKETTLQNVQTGNDYTLSLSGLPKGCYLLTVQTPQAKLTRKVMVQ